MSFVATTWLSDLRGTRITSAERSVLFILADMANDMGQCWPSHQTLAGKLQICSRQVARVLHALARKGLLFIEARLRPNRSKTSNRYLLDLEDTRHKCRVPHDINVGSSNQPLEPVRSSSAIATDEDIRIGVLSTDSREDISFDTSVFVTPAREENSDDGPSELSGIRRIRGEADKVPGGLAPAAAAVDVASRHEVAGGFPWFAWRPNGARDQRGAGASAGKHAVRHQGIESCRGAENDIRCVQEREAQARQGQSERAAFLARELFRAGVRIRA